MTTSFMSCQVNDVDILLQFPDPIKATNIVGHTCVFLSTCWSKSKGKLEGHFTMCFLVDVLFQLK